MPQPIDIHTELARATAAQRVQEIADRVSLAAQQRQAQHARDEQIEAETVVQQPPESEHEASIADRQGERDRQRRQTTKKTAANAAVDHPDHGAGELAVIPDSEQHRLDVHV